MNNDEAYKRIENIVFEYEEKELSSLDDRKLNNEALNHIREALKNERPQGRWVFKSSELSNGYMKCNKCDYSNFRKVNYNFCPHCGANMRGEE